MNSHHSNNEIAAEKASTLLEKDQLINEQLVIINEKDSAIQKKDVVIEEKEALIQSKNEVITEQEKRIRNLEAYLRLERSRRFGRSSEKSPTQEDMFNEAELLDNEAKIEEAAHTSPAKKPSGRKGLSKSLPRHQVHLNLSDEEKEGSVETFYKKVKEELDIVPAKARVLEYLQETAVFLNDQKRELKTAAKSKHPLSKCIASISLLAYVIVSKYCDGLPLYRLEGILKRYGGEITRTSMANWIIRLSSQFQPLMNLLREQQLIYDYIQADETRMNVLKEKEDNKTQRWMWISRGGPPDKPSVLFDYDPSRSKEVTLRLFDGFQGYFQSDGYAGYNALCHDKNIVQLGCWDHARRKFVEAEKAASSKDKKKRKVVAKYDVALGKIRKLYALEKQIKELPIQEKYEQRQKHAIPILEDLKQWLDKNIMAVAKGGKTHDAISYTLNQWPKLMTYCEDGRLNISNVLAENAIRPFVIGRKNWLFADTPNGARASATMYSLIETAKANGLEPYEYIKAVLGEIGNAETVEDIEALLPWNIKQKSVKTSSPVD